jgi:hypothetical protein
VLIVNAAKRKRFAVYPACQQTVDFERFELRVLIRIRDNDVVAAGTQLARNALRDFGEKRMHQIGDDQPDQIRPARYHQARRRTRSRVSALMSP